MSLSVSCTISVFLCLVPSWLPPLPLLRVRLSLTPACHLIGWLCDAMFRMLLPPPRYSLLCASLAHSHTIWHPPKQDEEHDHDAQLVSQLLLIKRTREEAYVRHAMTDPGCGEGKPLHVVGLSTYKDTQAKALTNSNSPTPVPVFFFLCLYIVYSAPLCVPVVRAFDR
jgi:hypothetical protein